MGERQGTAKDEGRTRIRTFAPSGALALADEGVEVALALETHGSDEVLDFRSKRKG